MLLPILFFLHPRFILLLLFPLLCEGSSLQSNPFQCEGYLAPSLYLNRSGFGIFAGRNFSVSESLASSPSLVFQNLPITYDWQLGYYSYSTYSEDYDSVEFGASALYNHCKNFNLMHYLPFETTPSSLETTPSSLNTTPSSLETNPYNCLEEKEIRFQERLFQPFEAHSIASSSAFEVTRPISAGEEMFQYYSGCTFFSYLNND